MSYRRRSTAATSWLDAGLVVVACWAGCTRSPDGAALAHVRALGGRATSLARVDLAQTDAADADLVRFVELAGGMIGVVEEIDLTRTRIGDGGLGSLAACAGLRKLVLTLTDVSDAGLSALSGLPRLEELYLIETPIGDGAVAAIGGFPRLRRLVIYRTRFSAAALERLRGTLPGVAIDVEPATARGPRAVP